VSSSFLVSGWDSLGEGETPSAPRTPEQQGWGGEAGVLGIDWKGRDGVRIGRLGWMVMMSNG
jgi:hypothetical protein